MFISSASPNGIITNLNLLMLPAWRLELIGTPDGKLGIGIRYVIPPTTTIAFIAAIDTRATGGEAQQIASKGLTRGERIADKDVFIESLQMLNNADKIKASDVDAILKDAPGLVDVYYKIIEGLHTGEAVSGSFLDWRWNLRPELTGISLEKTEEAGEDAP